MITYSLQADLEKGKYLLLNNGSTYSISDVLYEILLSYKNSETIEEISAGLIAKYNELAYTNEFVGNALAVVFEQLQKSKVENNLDDFLHAKITLIKEGALSTLYRRISILFLPYFYYSFILLSVGLTFYFFINNNLINFESIDKAFLAYLDLWDLILSYFIFIVIIFVHELGHAAATTYFGLKPKEIGFGLYFIFPVFYTNVSAIWQLKTSQRNVVNLGGIYFQLLINSILILLFIHSNTAGLLFNIILANSISMVFSLIPFFRYDGYWILSDSLGITNLTFKARDKAVSFFRKPSSIFSINSSKDAYITLYWSGSILFWTYVYYSVIRYTVFTSRIVYSNFHSKFWLLDSKDLLEFSVKVIGLLVASFFLVRHGINVIKYIKSIYKPNYR
ncbi:MULTISPECIES: hypothetical protein [unclassified Sphingobacterium]|uniref:hypothetical protein n=1 Tax=unclassified Sphingobacterium TaxID=2609468 RepID=UPI0025D49480|nr:MULTISPECIES: hypothetical protein [unclassified Sphingobacterium]